MGAPEMKEIAMGKRMHLDPAEHKSLDVFSFGTLAFALAYGFPYLPENPEDGQSQSPSAHPCCTGPPCISSAGTNSHTSSPPQEHRAFEALCACEGCATLSSLARRFPSCSGNASIMDLVRKCVSTKAGHRPTTEHLRNHALFTQAFYNDSSHGLTDPVDFIQLLRME